MERLLEQPLLALESLVQPEPIRLAGAPPELGQPQGRLAVSVLGHRGPLVSASFAEEGRRVLTASKDGTARIHDCAVCAPLGELMQNPIHALAITARAPEETKGSQ